jgi:predicted dehydrogenase
MEEHEMLKVGVIGMGGIGNQHADCYVSSAHAQVVAVCDMDQERADKAAARLGVKAYYDMDKMLEAEGLDIADVSTAGVENGSHHHAPTMAALEAGCHVMCEKPISNNITEAREMVASAAEKGLCFGVNLNHRFTPAAFKAKEWAEEGRLGEVNFINMALWIGNPRDDEFFHLRALHPHSIDVMRYFCGSIEYVQAFLKRSEGRVCWSNASINMKFANGVVGHLTGSYDMTTRHPMERCEVAGTRGRLVIDNVYEDLTLWLHDSEEVTNIHNSIFGGLSGFGDTFRMRIHRFCEQVAEGAAPETIDASGADALQAQEVIEAAIESHQTGQIVKLQV